MILKRLLASVFIWPIDTFYKALKSSQSPSLLLIDSGFISENQISIEECENIEKLSIENQGPTTLHNVVEASNYYDATPYDCASITDDYVEYPLSHHMIDDSLEHPLSLHMIDESYKKLNEAFDKFKRNAITKPLDWNVIVFDKIKEKRSIFRLSKELIKSFIQNNAKIPSCIVEDVFQDSDIVKKVLGTIEKQDILSVKIREYLVDEIMCNKADCQFDLISQYIVFSPVGTDISILHDKLVNRVPRAINALDVRNFIDLLHDFGVPMMDGKVFADIKVDKPKKIRAIVKNIEYISPVNHMGLSCTIVNKIRNLQIRSQPENYKTDEFVPWNNSHCD